MAKDMNRPTAIIQQAISTFFEEEVYRLIRQEAKKGTLKIDIDGKVKAFIETQFQENELQAKSETAGKLLRWLLASQVNWAALTNLYLLDIQDEIAAVDKAGEAPDKPHTEDDYMWIRLWGSMMDSDEHYIILQQIAALEDKAPLNATYKMQDGSWATTDGITNPDTRHYLGLDKKPAEYINYDLPDDLLAEDPEA